MNTQIEELIFRLDCGIENYIPANASIMEKSIIIVKILQQGSEKHMNQAIEVVEEWIPEPKLSSVGSSLLGKKRECVSCGAKIRTQNTQCEYCGTEY